MRHPSARAGDLFGCENGHVMCEAIEDIRTGDFPWLHKLGYWVGPIPLIGEPRPKCIVCGSEISLDKVIAWSCLTKNIVSSTPTRLGISGPEATKAPEKRLEPLHHPRLRQPDKPAGS